jgi:hypothetical protein
MRRRRKRESPVTLGHSDIRKEVTAADETVGTLTTGDAKRQILTAVAGDNYLDRRVASTTAVQDS